MVSSATAVTQKREVTGGGKVTHRSSPFCRSKSRKTLRNRRQRPGAGTGRLPSGEGEVTRRHGRRGLYTASAAVKPASGWPPCGGPVRSSQRCKVEGRLPLVSAIPLPDSCEEAARRRGAWNESRANRHPRASDQRTRPADFRPPGAWRAYVSVRKSDSGSLGGTQENVPPYMCLERRLDEGMPIPSRPTPWIEFARNSCRGDRRL